ncbi:MAG: type III pantothenate kinase [Armatimonadia bacterium]
MSYRLYADIGNSRLKLAAVTKGRWLPLITVSWEEACEGSPDPEQYLLKHVMKQLDKQNLAKSECDALVACTSTTEADDILDTLRNALGAPLRILGRDLQAKLESRYNPPEALGGDRVANAVAAYAEYGGPVIAIDLGSCITTEVISAEGVFLGGHIAAGLSALYEGIFQIAPQLEAAAEDDPQEASLPLGTSTSMALKMGVHLQLGATLDLLIAACRQALDDECALVVMTGGDAESMAESTQDEAVVVDTMLTLKGLRLIDEAANPPQ